MNEKQTEPKNIAPGFLLINKPQGANSFRTIAQIRRIVGNKKLKAGYAGTLDPFATGLLVVAIGREATRMLHALTRFDKKYIARAKLGEKTDTLDNTGQIIETCNAEIKEEKLFAAIKRLGKQYNQVPPIYCALKYNGVPLYKLARQKKKSADVLHKAVQTKERTVLLHELILTDYSPPFFTVETHVSHGTYIRTLMDDIARSAGSCATTHELKRTAVGNISLSDAVDLDELKTIEDIENNLIEREIFRANYLS